MTEILDNYIDDWTECNICHRKWKESSLEFEMCPECFSMLRSNNQYYESACIEQRLKYVQFKDPELAEVVKLIWKLILNES